MGQIPCLLRCVIGGRSPSSRRSPRPGACPLGPVVPLEDRALPSGTITLGPWDFFALDQPQVEVLMARNEDGTQILGPDLATSFLLDTGANSILVMASAVGEMSENGYQTEGTFLEAGIGGGQVFDISAPYWFFQAANGNGYEAITVGQVRVESNSEVDFSDFGPWGISGMPTMTGRVVNLDYGTPWTPGDDLESMSTSFEADVPATTRDRFSFPIDNRISYDPEPLVLSGDHPPVWADIPFLTAVPTVGSQAIPGNFVFDTGAQVSIISTRVALALGLDSNGDGQVNSLDTGDGRYEGELDVGGVGGTATAPVFDIDSIRVPTDQGVDLVWTGTPVIVTDLDGGEGTATLDGVFGSDLLTAGWYPHVWEGNPDLGYLSDVNLDFRNWDATGKGTVYFDITRDVPAVSVADVGVLEGNSGQTNAVFNVTLDHASDTAVTVRYATADGTATAGEDYVATSGDLTFAPGVTKATVSVPVKGDTKFESDETFNLNLSDVTEATYGRKSAVGTIRNDDAANVLQVSSVTPTASGFVAKFSLPIDPSALNLYTDVDSGSLGAPDLTLTGPGGAAVRGTVVVAADDKSLEFVATGPALPAGDYSLTMVSGASAFKDGTGGLLDGDGNGTTGDNYTGTVTIASGSARVVSLPDFVRGFGQPVVVPANGAGLPVIIDDAGGVTRVTFDLLYDPTLLDVTGVTPGASIPSGFTATLDTSVAGRARVTLDGPTALPAGQLPLVNLTAAVPATAPYAAKEVLRIANLQVNSGAIAARADSAVHVAAFAGDASGSRTYSGLDAALISAAAAAPGFGFAAFRNADPALVGDASGNGSLSDTDATLLARKAVGLFMPLLPDLPATGNPPAGGPDPRLFVPNVSGAPGSTVTVPVRLEVTEAGGVTFQAADYAISFDPSRFTVSNPRVAGTLLPGFTVVTNIDNTSGVVRVVLYSATPVSLPEGTLGDVLQLDFAVKPAAAGGASAVNLRAGSGTTLTGLNEGRLALSPAPTDGAADAGVDGTFTVNATALSVTGFRVNDGSAQRSRVTSLTVTFSSPVPGLTAANFQLLGFPGTVTVTPNGANTDYTLTFTGAGTEYGSLADGRYTLNVVGVTGLTGAGSFSFHRLFGDSDGDRDVDVFDLRAFTQALYNTGNLAAFDWDNDGDVDIMDYRQFLQRFGTFL
jgi:hypothetical protein